MPLALPAKLTALLPLSVRQPLLKARRLFWRFFPPRHLFVFGGRTPYWSGFGRDLYAQEPVFRAVIQECEQTLSALGGKSLLAHFEGPADAQVLADEGCLVQFVTVMQIALVELWRAYGVEPGAVLGFSNGEPAAVYAAGGLTRTDALRVSLSWALISQLETPSYVPLLLTSDHARANELCAGCPVDLFIMMDIDPARQTLFCALANIQPAKAYLRAQGVSFHQIKADPNWPYHTPILKQYAAALREPLTSIIPQPTTKPCYLTTLGGMLPIGTVLPQDYWIRPPQEPVYQYKTIQAAIANGYFVMTPIGMYPFASTSRSASKQTLDRVRFIESFHAGAPELETFAAMRQRLRHLGLAPS